MRLRAICRFFPVNETVYRLQVAVTWPCDKLFAIWTVLMIERNLLTERCMTTSCYDASDNCNSSLCWCVLSIHAGLCKNRIPFVAFSFDQQYVKLLVYEASIVFEDSCQLHFMMSFLFFLAAVAAALAWAADDMHTILYLLLALSVPMHRVFYCQDSFFWKMCKLWLSTLTDNSFFYFDYVLLVVYSDKTCSCKIKVNQMLLTLCLLGCVWNCSRRPMQCATLSLVTVIEIGTKIAVFFSQNRNHGFMPLCRQFWKQSSSVSTVRSALIVCCDSPHLLVSLRVLLLRSSWDHQQCCIPHVRVRVRLATFEWVGERGGGLRKADSGHKDRLWLIRVSVTQWSGVEFAVYRLPLKGCIGLVMLWSQYPSILLM